MKQLLILAIALNALIASPLHAAETYVIDGVAGKSKREAIVALVTKPNVKVLRVQEVELSDKGTIKNKK